MKRSIPILLALAVLGGALESRAGIVTHSYRKAVFIDFAKKVEKAMEQVEKAHRTVTRIARATREKSSTPEDPVYAALAKAAGGLEGPYQAATAAASVVAEARAKVKEIYGDSASLSDDDPRWKELMKVKDAMQKAAQEIEKNTKEMNSHLEAFAKQGNQAGIWEVSAESLEKKVQIQSENILVLREKYKGLASQRLRGDGKKARERLRLLLEEAEGSWKGIKAIMAQFKKSPDAKVEFLYGGPGIASNQVVVDLKTEHKKMKKTFKRFKKEYVRLEGRAAWKQDEADEEGEDEDAADEDASPRSLKGDKGLSEGF
jgi:hypothetical protein